MAVEAEPRDYMRENLRRLRAMQRDGREREAQEMKQPVKALWKSSKYDNVESKVKEDLEVIHIYKLITLICIYTS